MVEPKIQVNVGWSGLDAPSTCGRSSEVVHMVKIKQLRAVEAPNVWRR